MPRIKYVDYRPKGDALQIIERAVDVLDEFTEQGYNLTLRQLFYQFVGRDLFPDSWTDPVARTKNTQKNYKKLGDIVARAREAGLIDWHHITDRTRSVSGRHHWDDPRTFLREATPQFNIDLWADQPRRVVVYVEKDALVDVVGRAARPFDVPYFANKGYLSASAAWDVAYNHMRVWHQTYGQPTVILHLGDHDPSGINMTQDVLERAVLFTRPTNVELRKYGRPDITIQRLALNMDQVRRYAPPPNFAKETDPRFVKYQEQFGDESWELDALNPAVIVDIIHNAILGLLDGERFNARQALEEQAREQLVTIASQYEDVVGFLGLEFQECQVPPRPPRPPRE